MSRRAVYGMGGKVDLKKLNREIRADIKKLQNRKKELVKQGKFTGERKTYFNERIRELKKHL